MSKTAFSSRVRIAALALVFGALAALAPLGAAADPRGDGKMHPDETATTFRSGDDLTIAFWCAQHTHAEKAAVEGVEEISRQLILGNCSDSRPDGLKVVLRDFESGPYWFADDLTPWSLWQAETDEGETVFALVPDTMGPHEVEKKQL